MNKWKYLKLNWNCKFLIRYTGIFRSPRAVSKGFSLIEMIIAVIIFAIISTVIANVLATSIRMYGDVRSRKDLNLDGQYSVFLFSREYSHLPKETGLQLAEEKKIRFKTNLGYTVQYFLQNGLFSRNVIGQGGEQILSKSIDVGNSRFRYFKQNNNELTNFPLSTADLQIVWKVELLVNMANATDTISYIANVYPENFKLATGQQCSEN